MLYCVILSFFQLKDKINFGQWECED